MSCLNVYWYTYQGKQLFHLFQYGGGKGVGDKGWSSTLKAKNLLFMSKFFAFRVDPIFKRFRRRGKQAGSYKSCFPLKK